MSSYERSSGMSEEISMDTTFPDQFTGTVLERVGEHSPSSNANNTALDSATQGATCSNYYMELSKEETMGRRCGMPMCSKYAAVNGDSCTDCARLRCKACKSKKRPCKDCQDLIDRKNSKLQEFSTPETICGYSSSDNDSNEESKHISEKCLNEIEQNDNEDICTDDVPLTPHDIEYNLQRHVKTSRIQERVPEPNIGSPLGACPKAPSIKRKTSTTNKPEPPKLNTKKGVEKIKVSGHRVVQSDTNRRESDANFINPVNNKRSEQNPNDNHGHVNKNEEQTDMYAANITIPVNETSNEGVRSPHNDNPNETSSTLNEDISLNLDVEIHGYNDLRTRHVSRSEEPATKFTGQTTVRHINGEEIDSTRLDINERTAVLDSRQRSPDSTPNSIANMCHQNQNHLAFQAFDSPSVVLDYPIVQDYEDSVLELLIRDNLPDSVNFEVTSVDFDDEDK